MISIVAPSWAEGEHSLRAIRQQVFVEEQQVPVELEWDGLDEGAQHWLALDGETPVGTVRLLPDGHLGRMAVLSPYRRQGIGRQLLDAVLSYALSAQLLEVYLYAQVQALSFYERAGFQSEGEEFMDAGIVHRTMRRRILPRRLLGVHGGKFAVNDLLETTIDLIAQTERQLRILSYDLAAEIYDQPQLVAAVSALARRGRFSEIRILICSSQGIAGKGHQLVRLQQRLSSTIKLRTLSDDVEDIADNWVIADRSAVISQSIKEPGICWANFNNRPIAEDYQTQFDRLWGRAKPDPNLRPVDI